MNPNNLIGENKFYKNLEEKINKPLALRDRQNMQALVTKIKTQIMTRLK